MMIDVVMLHDPNSSDPAYVLFAFPVVEGRSEQDVEALATPMYLEELNSDPEDEGEPVTSLDQLEQWLEVFRVPLHEVP
jgi:hypothetical protein